MKKENINTLRDLKKSGYQPKTIQQELAHNLKTRLKKGLPSFEGLIGYENTVIPDVERAILSYIVLICSFPSINICFF